MIFFDMTDLITTIMLDCRFIDCSIDGLMVD